jgi:transposase
MDELALSRRQRLQLEEQLRRTRDAHVYRRTLAILEWDRGQPISQIARMLCVNRRSVYRWIEAYGEAHDPSSLEDDARAGRPREWTDDCSVWLQAFLRTSPVELGYFAGNWTVPLLQECLELSTQMRFSDDTLRRALKDQGYAWKRTRYVLVPDPEREKKTTYSPGNPLSSAA